MKRFALTIAMVFGTMPVFAQDNSELARQYVNLPAVQQMIDAMFSPSSMGAQVANSLPPNLAITPDQQARIGTVMSQAMNDMRPKMEALMMSGSAETFSTGELLAMIDFYQSEHGASILAKTQPFMTSIMAQLAPEMATLQQKVGPEVAKILQEQN